ncbi:MAG: hypothetical protein ACREHV_02295, partial [Rhizomicrobium sp.]
SSPSFSPSTAVDGLNGFSFLAPTNWLLIEGDTFNFLGNNIENGEGGSSPIQYNITIRRNVIENAYNQLEVHTEGLFTSDVGNLTVEDNVFDHGGWNGTLIQPMPVTISVASPAVVTIGTNYLANNEPITFTTTGSLPTGLIIGTVYCVMNYATTTFNVYDDGGNCAGDSTAIDASGSQSGTQDVIWQGPQPDEYNRNNYLDNGGSSSTVFNDNIDAEGASGGVQMREGGTTENNLFLQDPISITYGNNESSVTQTVGGTIADNVILDAEDIGTTTDSGYQPQGEGIGVYSYYAGDGFAANLIDGLNIYDNLIAHQVQGTGNIYGLVLGSGGAPFTDTDVHNNVIYDWGNGLSASGATGFYISIPTSGSSGNTFEDNQIQMPNGATIGSTDGTSGGSITLSDNSYYSANPTNQWFYDNTSYVSTSTWNTEMGDTGATYTPVSYTDNTRDIQTYDSEVLGGPGTFADFMAGADAQSYEDWNPAYTPEVVNDWMRAGYGLPQI